MTLRQAGAALFGLGMTLFALGVGVWFASVPDDLAPHKVQIIGAAKALTAFSAALIVLSLTLFVIHALRRSAEFAGDVLQDLMDKVLAPFDERWTTLEELEQVCSLGTTEIGDNHPSPESLRDRWNRNPKIVRALYEPQGSTNIVGYTIIYPITRAAEKKIKSGDIGSAKAFASTHIRRSLGGTKVAYVSMLCASGPLRRAAVELLLRKQLLALPRLENLYARPASKRGRALLLKYGFRPVISGSVDGVWELPRDKLRQMLNPTRCAASRRPA